MVKDLLLGFVHEAWVEDLDFSTLEKVNGSFVSDDLRDREDDIIWKVRWGKDWLYIYLLLEFQATIDKYMALRIMVYEGLLYQDLIKTGQISSKDKLPPILPIVLYNGKPRWTAPLNINTLIEEVGGGLEKYRPDLQYLLLDEGTFTDSQLKPLNNLVAALFSLENSNSRQDIIEVITALLKWLSTDEQSSLRRAFTVWFRRVFFPIKRGIDTPPPIEDIEEVRTMLAERVKEWTAEWREEGLTKGRKEGRKEGREEGITLLLQSQIKFKFGSLSPTCLAKLNNADSKTLLKFSERILTAESIDDIFEN